MEALGEGWAPAIGIEIWFRDQLMSGRKNGDTFLVSMANSLLPVNIRSRPAAIIVCPHLRLVLLTRRSRELLILGHIKSPALFVALAYQGSADGHYRSTSYITASGVFPFLHALVGMRLPHTLAPVGAGIQISEGGVMTMPAISFTPISF